MSLDEDDSKMSPPRQYTLIVQTKKTDPETKETTTTPVHVVLSEPAMKMCGMLVKAFEDTSTTELPLENVDASEMEHVRRWLEHRVKTPVSPLLKLECPPPLQTNVMKDLVDDFDVAFTEQLSPSPNESDALFGVAFVANYLDCQPLVRLMMLKFGTYLKGHTPEEIIRDLKIRTDISEEEEKQNQQDFRDLLKQFEPDASDANDNTAEATKKKTTDDEKKNQGEHDEEEEETPGSDFCTTGHTNRRDR